MSRVKKILKYLGSASSDPQQCSHDPVPRDDDDNDDDQPNSQIPISPRHHSQEQVGQLVPSSSQYSSSDRDSETPTQDEHDETSSQELDVDQYHPLRNPRVAAISPPPVTDEQRDAHARDMGQVAEELQHHLGHCPGYLRNLIFANYQVHEKFGRRMPTRVERTYQRQEFTWTEEMDHSLLSGILILEAKGASLR